ncbi:hypothetical protein [uncultured Paraglaciecola sp.]|uniref:hypothetical protein n=1 Tax=uncultured Paraglaciecola sp. TaxID=1765024 RepID=UPI002595A2AB|nr:hypothetical protein [uncultured Paraglaciecola sp.]
MKKLYLLIALSFLCVQSTQAIELSTNVLLRYENETGQTNLAPRRRLRMIASVGANYRLNNNVIFMSQVRTGLKNNQNVPAITLHQITNNPSGDKDIYVSRAFTKFTFDKVSVIAGKIPWKSKQVTDLFWDRHLNPIGVHFDYDFAENQRLTFATFKPLDGASSTVGHMSLIQYSKQLSTHLGKITLSPWLVDYKGEAGASYATKDTQFNNQFIRFSGAMTFNDFQIGADLGWSTKRVPNSVYEQFSKQRFSYVFKFSKGALQHVGSYLTELKYLHVERFSVVTEFAQNASSRFTTSNYKGWDLRIRHRLTNNLWIGSRLSKTKRLVGSPEQSVRFRIETKLSF